MDRTPAEAADHIDEVLPQRLVAIGGLIGGPRDPLPSAAQPRVTPCHTCAQEHRCFADGDGPDAPFICLGCLARLVTEASPLPGLAISAPVARTLLPTWTADKR